MSAPGLVVVTGADGFVGRALVAHFRATGRPCRAVVRAASGGPATNPDARRVIGGDLATASDATLAALVAGAAAVVHLAGRAHVPAESGADAEARCHAANVVATARLAAAARAAGVRRFVFASSVKVNGEATPAGGAFGPAAAPAPQDAYARSKLAAERALAEACAGSPLAPVVLRLPLVYGPGVKANFLALIDEVARRRRLPLAAVRNRRSLLYVGNLVTAIDAALDVPMPPAGVHFVADAEPVSVPALIIALAAALDEPARLWPLPLPLLTLAARVVGKGAAVARLTQSLVVDPSSFVAATGWRPPFTLAEGLAATAAWWRNRHAI